MLKINRLDHLVLTVKNIDETCDFYCKLLGFELITFGEGRKALRFGRQKLNLHEAGRELEPKAKSPRPGSADLCFISELSIEAVLAALSGAGAVIEQGPIERTGAEGPIRSVYLRDPDGNLIEISSYNG